MDTTLKIALLRAKCVAVKDFGRAVQILLNAGLDFNRAASYVFQIRAVKKIAA